MNRKHYPLHPGQEHPQPYYCTIPLEDYEQMMEENKNVRQIKASIEKILQEFLDRGLLECWFFNGTYHATLRTAETMKLEEEFRKANLNRGVMK